MIPMLGQAVVDATKLAEREMLASYSSLVLDQRKIVLDWIRDPESARGLVSPPPWPGDTDFQSPVVSSSS